MKSNDIIIIIIITFFTLQAIYIHVEKSYIKECVSFFKEIFFLFKNIVKNLILGSKVPVHIKRSVWLNKNVFLKVWFLSLCLQQGEGLHDSFVAIIKFWGMLLLQEEYFS